MDKRATTFDLQMFLDLLLLESKISYNGAGYDSYQYFLFSPINNLDEPEIKGIFEICLLTISGSHECISNFWIQYRGYLNF